MRWPRRLAPLALSLPVLVLLSVATAVIVLVLLPPQYEAKASMGFRRYVPGDSGAVPAALTELYAQSARAVPTLSRVIARHLISADPDALRDRVTANASDGTLTITARGDHPQEATALANLVAEELLTLRSRSIATEIGRYLAGQLEVIRSMVGDARAQLLELGSGDSSEAEALQTRIDELEELEGRLVLLERWSLAWPLRFTDPATQPVTAVDRPVAQLVLLAGLVGLASAYVAYRLRTAAATA